MTKRNKVVWGGGAISRREILKLAAVGAIMPLRSGMPRGMVQAVNAVQRRGHMHTRFLRRAISLDRYVDALPIPGVIRPTGLRNGVPQYSVGMSQFNHRIHRDMAPTTVWGYNGSYPGPTFEVRSGQAIDVTWSNNLPSRHLLESAYDDTIHGADIGQPHARTVTHLHGAKVMPESDGYPEAWFTNGFAQTGPAFSNRTYHYTNEQDACGLWYHDHALGITRLNVYTGLAGFYFIRDAQEDALDLPRGRYEIPLLLQDRMFEPWGDLLYPIELAGTHKVWIPEFFGDHSVVNGKAWPYLDVEPRKYRFRMLNGSNARFYHLQLVQSNGAPGPVFEQIGTDGGLLPRPVQLSELSMAPAERFDVVIDFRGFEGQHVTLTNDANQPFPGGDPVDLSMMELMQFRVGMRVSEADRPLPQSLRPIALIDPRKAKVERTLMLSEADRDSDGYPIMGLLGGSPLNATVDNPTGGLTWSDPVTETVKAGHTEIWNFVNITTDAHPIHVHLVQFQVIERRTFDLARYMATGKLQFTGDPIAPEPNERPAWKDTVKALPGLDVDGNVTGLVTRVVAKFDAPRDAKPGDKLRYVWHCHILEHEDEDMMRPFDVIV